MNNKQIKEKKERNSCKCCNKNLYLFGIKCRCDNLYCYNCLDIKIHNCNFDYKLENQNILRKKILQVVAEKVIKI